MRRFKFPLLVTWLILCLFAVSSFAQDAPEMPSVKGERADTGSVDFPCPTSSPIAFGQTVNGELRLGDCTSGGFFEDEFRFTGSAGQRIVVIMNSDAINQPGLNTVDSFLFLRRADTGAVIASNDDGGTNGSEPTSENLNARIPALTGFFTLPTNGEYVITATTFGAGDTGFYSVTLVNGGVPPCTTEFLQYSLPPENSRTDSLSTTDCLRRGQFYADFFAITGAGQSVTWDLTSTEFDAYLILRRDSIDGPIVAENNDGGGGTNARITQTLLPGVVYFVEATSALSNQTGNYSLTFTTNLPANTVPVSIPFVNATRGTTIAVPINVGSLTGRGIFSYQFDLVYDATVLQVVAANPVSTGAGTITPAPPAYTVTVNNTTPGRLRVAVNSNNGTPLTGAGVLLNFNFNVIGNNGTSTPLRLQNFRFNEGTPLNFVFFGGVFVNQFRITGNVVYGIFINGSSGADTSRLINNVNLTAVGNPVVTGVTNVRGAYELNGLGAGPYTATPRKFGDSRPDPGSTDPPFITGFDASIAARIAVGLPVNPTNGTATVVVPAILGATPTNQQVAADVSGNGEITAFDAALMASFAANLPNPSPNRSGSWVFNPASRTYATITANLTNQDYQAILIGDPSGNFRPQCAPPGSPLCTPLTGEPDNAIDVSLPQMRSSNGTAITVPINVGDLTGRGAFSFDFDLRFDPNVLRLAPTAISSSGTRSEQFAIVVNPNEPGRLRIAAYGTQPLSGDGTLLNLNFEVIGAPGANSQLRWHTFFFNEGNPATNNAHGTFLVSGRTPFDFDGDGRSDVSVYRNGNWFIQRSTDGFIGQLFGMGSDRVAPGDFDGDGRNDLAVWRENTGAGYAHYHITLSSNNSYRGELFGAPGDLPVVGDWDGDGRAEMGVYRNGATTGAQSYFYHKSLTGSGFVSVPFGMRGDVPVVGDYDGDRKLDAAVFRTSTGDWFIRQSSDGAVRSIRFGFPTDRPVQGDYDGDGRTDIAVYRDGNWYIQQSRDGFRSVYFGMAGDRPVVGDYDGDGRADAAVFRNGNWYWLRSTNGALGSMIFGLGTDQPVPNAYVP